MAEPVSVCLDFELKSKVQKAIYAARKSEPVAPKHAAGRAENQLLTLQAAKAMRRLQELSGLPDREYAIHDCLRTPSLVIV